MDRHLGFAEVPTPESIQIVCPNCGRLIWTDVTFTPSIKTHLIAIIICAFIMGWQVAIIRYASGSAGNMKINIKLWRKWSPLGRQWKTSQSS